MWIDELQRDLIGRQLAIWTGYNEDGTQINLPQTTCDAYRAMWRREAKLAGAPELDDVCRHRGDRLRIPQAVAIGLPTPTREWHECRHKGRPLAGTVVVDDRAYVCTCSGCGVKCPGYDEDEAEATAGPVVVNNNASGLGDAMLGLLAVAGYRRENPSARITYRVGHGAVPFAKLFTGYDVVTGNSEPAPAGVTYFELDNGYRVEQDTKCREPRLRRYCRNAGVKIPIMPRLRDRPAVLAAGADAKGAIVLCPFSSSSDREYALTGWLAVENKLRAAGYRTIVVHSHQGRCWILGSEKLIGADPVRLAGVMLNAAAVVGIDSGPAHLAGVLGTPLVVLEGPTRVDGVFYGYANVTRVAGSLPCSGCHWNGPWNRDDCAPRCPSLQGVNPDAVVAAAVAAALAPREAMDRTLLTPGKLATLRDAVRATARLPGDLAELGVCRGGSAFVLCKFAESGRVRLFDTFAGLPADCPEGVHRAGEFAADERDVLQFLKGYPVVSHKGLFPATAPEHVKYRFVHVDGDLYQTTKDAIAYFAPRMVPGGIMLFDDYRWKDTPGVARALDEARPDVEPVGEFQAMVRF